jgi:hypothetical protein
MGPLEHAVSAPPAAGVTWALCGLLVPLLIPGGIALAAVFDTFTTQWQFALPMVPVGMAVYYLAWKYGVRFLNNEMGIG